MITDEMVEAAFAEWARLQADGVLGIAAMREALRAAQGVRPVMLGELRFVDAVENAACTAAGAFSEGGR